MGGQKNKKGKLCNVPHFFSSETDCWLVEARANIVLCFSIFYSPANFPFFFFLENFPRNTCNLKHELVSCLDFISSVSQRPNLHLYVYSSYLKLLFFVFIWFLHDICFSLAVLLQRAGKNGSSIKEWSPETKNNHATATSSEISGELLVFVLDFFFFLFWFQLVF